MTSSQWIADKIKKLCDENNLSINKLAEKACMTQSTLNSIIQGESKNPKISTLAKISHVFGLTLSQFLENIEAESNILD